jgi:hypothetical protein
MNLNADDRRALRQLLTNNVPANTLPVVLSDWGVPVGSAELQAPYEIQWLNLLRLAERQGAAALRRLLECAVDVAPDIRDQVAAIALRYPGCWEDGTTPADSGSGSNAGPHATTVASPSPTPASDTAPPATAPTRPATDAAPPATAPIPSATAPTTPATQATPPDPVMAPPVAALPEKRRILVLTANPRDTTQLRLDLEVREIMAGLERARRRDDFELIQRWAVRPVDLHRAMLDVNPHIVHFSGHGSGEDGLILEGLSGETRLVSGEALSALFELSGHVECVVLNACYSEVQATAIARAVDYVVGMSREIEDRAALEFAVAFYDTLGAGRSFEEAYRWACVAIQLAGVPGHLTPVLKKRAAPAPAAPASSEAAPIDG